MDIFKWNSYLHQNAGCRARGVQDKPYMTRSTPGVCARSVCANLYQEILRVLHAVKPSRKRCIWYQVINICRDHQFEEDRMGSARKLVVLLAFHAYQRAPIISVLYRLSTISLGASQSEGEIDYGDNGHHKEDCKDANYADQ